MTSRVPRVRLALVATSVAILSAGLIEAAFLTVATSRLVTNSTGGKNQDPSVDKSGGLIVFTSNVDHEKLSGATFGPTQTFDFNGDGNSFTPVGATHPNPSCANCTSGNSGVGNLYLWRAKKKAADPANSFKQLTFSTVGGFAANQKPDLNQKGTIVAWDSDQDPTGGNADGNREIFVMPISGSPITQVTNTTGNGQSANRNVNQSDDGKLLVFESTVDYASAACKLNDGTSPCGNPDGNVEIMLYRKATNDFVQITQTTGGGTSSNLRPRISNDGRFVAFQSTRDFAGALPGGATCTLLDGTSACDNADGNGDIMLFDLKENVFTQITKTAPGSGCSGTTANERVEVSTRGNYVTFQSTCEAQLNPTGCGDCNGNDEVFLASLKKRTLQQVTISDAGFNRVPRVSGSGAYIVFESNRNYKSLNLGHARTIYIVKRNTGNAPAGLTSPGQLLEDATSTLVQNSKAQLTTTTITGGFNSSIEQFGVSTNGKVVSFDNQKLVGNQEIWYVDRTK